MGSVQIAAAVQPRQQLIPTAVAMADWHRAHASWIHTPPGCSRIADDSAKQRQPLQQPAVEPARATELRRGNGRLVYRHPGAAANSARPDAADPRTAFAGAAAGMYEHHDAVFVARADAPRRACREASPRRGTGTADTHAGGRKPAGRRGCGTD